MIDASAYPFNGNAQAALNALTALGGGRLYLPAGDYGPLVAEFASIPNARTSICGDGEATKVEGLKVRKAAWMQVSDLTIEGGALGLDCQDVEQSRFERVNVRWCEKAGHFQPGTLTDPNSLTFADCTFANNTVEGLTIENGNAIKFDGGSTQYNAAFGQKLINAGTGYGGIEYENHVFEGNHGTADLWVEQGANGFYKVDGGGFMRTGLGWADRNIKMDAGVLVLDGPEFNGRSGYVPDALRQCLDLGAAVELSARSVTFENAIEAPVWKGFDVQSRKGAAWGRKSPLGFYAWDCPNGNAFYVGGPFSLGSGLAFGVVNSANTALQPVEWRAAEHLFTGPVRLGPHDPVTNTVQVKDTAGTVRRLQCL